MIVRIITIMILVCAVLVSYAHAEPCLALLQISPCIDAGVDIGNGISYNGLPRTGKYPGDKPDIGAYEWFPGVTCDNPTGDWTGVPLDYNPLDRMAPPSNLQVVMVGVSG